jgi:hypothetical protein
MSREATSGILRFDQDCICYQLPNGGWRLPVSEIKIIGEYTDDQGPLVDDYFLVFLTDSNLYEASIYAEGVDAFLQELRDRLGASLSLELGNSTSYRSRVIWPSDMVEVPVFDYSKTPKPKGLLDRLKYRFFPDIHRKLSHAVWQRLK